MRARGFIPYDKEWWHFTLRNEPFPNSYFDFPVRRSRTCASPGAAGLSTSPA